MLQPARDQNEIFAAGLTPTARRLKLLANGYAPLPIEGKRPPLKDWQKKTDTNAAEIELWEKVYPQATNTGILTQLTPTLDIDITNPEPPRPSRHWRGSGSKSADLCSSAPGKRPSGQFFSEPTRRLKKLPAGRRA